MLESHLRTDIVRGKREVRLKIERVDSMVLASSV